MAWGNEVPVLLPASDRTDVTEPFEPSSRPKGIYLKGPRYKTLLRPIPGQTIVPNYPRSLSREVHNDLARPQPDSVPHSDNQNHLAAAPARLHQAINLIFAALRGPNLLAKPRLLSFLRCCLSRSRAIGKQMMSITFYFS